MVPPTPTSILRPSSFSLLRLQLQTRLPQHRHRRFFQSSTARLRELKNPQEITDYLSTSTWSISTLLPTASQLDTANEVTLQQLRHLLRLSALQPPSSAEEEEKMLRDLHAQLHFVRQIQDVDTEGVKPLEAIRDETEAAEAENELGMEAMREALEAEEVVGRFHKRIRRRKSIVDEQAKKAEDWDVLGQAGKRVGRYFVVESGRDGKAADGGPEKE